MKHISLLLCFLFALSGSPVLAGDSKQQEETDVYQNLETFANVLNLLQLHYVDDISSRDVLIEAINGMLTSLDPHSSYMSPEDFQELQEETKGSFTGIGIEITIRDGYLTVVSPIEGTPAYRQGLQASDQIIKINGRLTKKMTLMDAIKMLRGKKGSEVTITIQRKEWPDLLDIVIVRDIIPLQSVKSIQLEPGVFLIRITNFQASTTKDVRKIIQQATRKQPLDGLILDMRNNPGGLLDQAVKVSDIFIDKGVIVTTKGRDPDQDMVFDAHQGTAKYDFPMIVLVNGGSASAAEIVAGALQDHGRALILGTQTFGKGSVQTIVPLPNGAGLRMTTARYYTPSGVSIQATGITPDMVVPYEEPEKKNGEKGKNGQIREKDLHHYIENNKGKKKDQEVGSEQQEVEKRLAKDNQLRTALFLLKNLNEKNLREMTRE